MLTSYLRPVARVAGIAALAIYFVFCLVFLTLRYGLMPNIHLYKPQIEQMASHALSRPVSIGAINASWSGFTPQLALTDVLVQDRAGGAGLRLPYASASLSWWSVVHAQLRLGKLEIQRPDLDIRRDAEGRIFVAGIFMDPASGGNGGGLDWILSQRRIVVQDGRIRWNDAQRAAPELLLEHVQLRVENIWQKHAFALKAVPPSALAAPIELRGRFSHPPFARKISDIKQWTGTLYTDLSSPAVSGWNAYLDLPMAISKGNGSVRSWLSLNHGKLADLTVDLALSDVSARLGPTLPLLNLSTASGRISISENLAREAIVLRNPAVASAGASAKPLAMVSTDTSAMASALAGFGSDGHTISLTNFTMQTADGLRLPQTTISETFTPARNGQAEHIALSAKLLDLETLANFIERLPLPEAQRQMLQDFSPKGVISDFSASWHGTYPQISDYALKGRFANLSLQAQPARAALPKTASAPAQAAIPAIPGFDNLTGAVEANARGGTFSLDSSNLTLQLPGMLAQPRLVLNRLGIQASWQFQENNQLLFSVQNMQFSQNGLQGRFSGSHRLPIDRTKNPSLGVIDLQGELNGFDLARTGEFLPVATPQHLREWLSGALTGGSLQDGKIRLKGDLANFPFRQISNQAGKPGSPGIFTFTGRVENGQLNVAPGHFAQDGKAPLWPVFDAFEGDVSIDRTRLEITGKSATVQNAALSRIRAVVPDLLATDKVLTVDGIASGALQELFGFVNNSPVAGWTGHFTQETKATGNGVLALKLQLPLARLPETKVQGVVELANNNIALQKILPTLFQTSGKFEFHEKGFRLDGLKATFLGGPVIATGGTQADGSIVIKAEGSVTSDGIAGAYASPSLQRLFQSITGSTRYDATIAVRQKQLEVLVESSLQGLALDFPAPLQKAAGENLPLKVELAALPAQSENGSTVLRDEIRISLGTAMAALYQRQKATNVDALWQVISGGIGVNVPAPKPESGVNINVNLKTLDIDAWRSLAGAVTAAETKTQPALVASAAGNVPESSLNQYLEPEVLSARATELIIGGKKLDNVVVGMSHYKDIWQANIDASQASGYVTWNESRSGRGMGKVTARLSSLIIPKSAATDVTDILEGKSATTQMPAIDIVAENFELLGKKMGRVEIIANNIRNPSTGESREWRISKLLLSNADAELKATGSWKRPNDTVSMTNLDYRLDMLDAGRLLERFGFGSVLKGGKGVMKGTVSWHGLPFSLDVPSLDGQMRIDMASGQFLKVNPGAAKLLGVLSLQSLPRRLTLDFRDVFSEGFAFDGVAGTINIANGIAKTENLKMRSVSATVVMDGSADIARETQDLHVAVIPEINVGTASVVYALAVNPVIGLGSFLAQLFLRAPLMRAFTFEYQITGPWSAPQVLKVKRNDSNDNHDEQPAVIESN